MTAGKEVAKSAAKKRGLGRGLEALLGPKAAAEALPLQAMPGDQLRSLPIDAMVPGKYQPRRSMDEAKLEELASSIRSQGVIQPIVVREQLGADGKGGRTYEIIAGERRWRASQRAGLREMPAVIRVVDEVKELMVQHVFGVAGGFCSPLCVDVESVMFPVGNSGAELPCVRKLCTQNDTGTTCPCKQCRWVVTEFTLDADSSIQRIFKWAGLTRNIAITYSDHNRCFQLHARWRGEHRLEKSKIGDGDKHHDDFSGCLERCQACCRISKAVKLYAHPVHEAKVKAADLAVFIPLVTVIDDTASR